MNSINRPLIAVTMGDPAGIGPEICARALLRPEVLSLCRPVLIGDIDPMRGALRALGRTDARLHILDDLQDAVFVPGVINMLALGAVAGDDYQPGQIGRIAGDAAYRYVEKAIHLALDKDVDATVTAPLCKESLHMAGHNFAGHTEIYAHLTNTDTYAMMLAHRDFRVMHVSTHVSLLQACKRVQRARVLQVIELAHKACKGIGIAHPRIAVAGLNPHSGEGGLFGREEIEQISPAIEDARALGIDASGPLPPDTAFVMLNAKKYDICVCMYHDQGHIPVKLLGFEVDPQTGALGAVSGVNITMGLPIIRVSVDHGTAFDIAGKGIASDESLLSALEYAARMSLAQKGV